RLDLAGRERVDSFIKIRGIVTKHEINADFLHDALQRLNLIGLHTDADHHDLAARPDHADRLFERAFDADTFEYQFGAARGHRADLIRGMVVIRIKDDIRAEFAREFRATLGEFRNHHRRALPFRPRQGREPDRPGAHHDDRLAGFDAGALSRMQA